jgi:ubiquinone/menaquinone biosynthesis C-methylase UbiE
MNMTNDLVALSPTTRFSNRVENYVKYRPSYPEAIIPFLEKNIDLQKENRIVDIGSGTGLFSELFLKNGYPVIGVEPNNDMRKAGEKKLAHYPDFTSINHRAEETGLRSNSIDLITVAQAFHWMEPAATKREFMRILKPGGHIVLAYNLRLAHTPFLKAYEELKQKFGDDYHANKTVSDASIKSFYYPAEMKLQQFDNMQLLDFDALKGQLLSASYIPLPGHLAYNDMITDLAQLFVQYNKNGFVKMEYETKLYYNA